MPETSPTVLRKSVFEYVQTLKTSPKYGPRVVCHRSFSKSNGTYSPFPNNLPKELIQCLKYQYHTRPLSEKQTEILKVLDQKTYAGYSVSLGKLLVSEKVTGYQKRINRSNKLSSTTLLDLPEQVMETVGIWIDIPDICMTASLKPNPIL